MKFNVNCLIFCIFITSTTTALNLFKDSMTIQIKNLRCENVNPKIYNGSVKCSIKPKRNDQSITNVRYTYGKPCNDLWVQIKIFYRYPTGIKYQPWMIDIDEDVCGLGGMIDKLRGPAVFLANALLKYAPGLIHKCPYIGEEGLKDANVDEILSNTIPQIIPKGWYKALMRFHLANNDTFLNVWLTGKLDARDPMKAYDMGK